MLFVDDQDRNAVMYHTYEYSTLKPVNDRGQNILAPPAVQSVGVDTDKDGNIDQWNITMSIRKPELYYKLEDVNIIVAFDYKTDDSVNMQMEALAVA